MISKFALEPEKFPGFSRNGRLICPNGNGDSKLKQVILGPAPGVRGWGGGVLLGILNGLVPPGSPNPDPISDHKM